VIDTAGEGWLEDEWCGRAILAIGAVRMAPQEPCVRCTMVTRPQPGLGEDRDIFRTLARHHGGLFGVWTAVATPGLLTVGSEVSVERMTSDPFGAQIPLGQQRRGHDEPRPVDVG
jgi:uncharacterized protein YcbX